MARRLSSIFSLSSNNSVNSNDDARLSPYLETRVTSDGGPAKLGRKSAPNLRGGSPNLLAVQQSQTGQSPEMTPPFTPILYPPPEDGMRPPQNLKPLPLRSDSPAESGIGPDSSPRLSASQNTSGPRTPGEKRATRPRSWLPSRSRVESSDEGDGANPQQAWMISPEDKTTYNLAPLTHFQIVPELWNENGDTLVYLHSRESSKGPSFRVDSASFVSSRKLSAAAFGTSSRHEPRATSEVNQRGFPDRVQSRSTNAPLSPPTSQHGSPNRGSSTGSRSNVDYFEDWPIKKEKEVIHLCVPLPFEADISKTQVHLSSDEIERLVTMRNTFAFLTGKPLVATAKLPTLFSIFLQIADVLKRYEFTNLDGSTLGEEPASSFANYVTDFRLRDVKSSQERTIEAIVLGERMKSWDLYNEGFVHGVGKYEDISELKNRKFRLITDASRKRMERAHLDLHTRLRNVRTRLEDYNFPSMFAGIANSHTSNESKIISFKDWKNSYLLMRRHVINFYKLRYGAWPPKAKSKKNDFEESGLNRLLLRELYQDFSDLYDVLVDRTALTTRSGELPTADDPEDPQEPTPRALRRILEEYDRSTPPVQPPVPFDTPLIPSLSDTRRGFSNLDPKKQKKEKMKRLADDEINKALMQSYNRDSIKSTPFLEAFMIFERRSAHGKTMDEIADLRSGQWIFLYAVIQSLPLVVVDAPGVSSTRGVEYFLCEVPRGTPPWVENSGALKQSWYGIAGGVGIVNLPADIVEHGVEGIYHRSHCWEAAQKWAGYGEIAIEPPAVIEPPPPSILRLSEDLALPPPAMLSAPGFRSTSPGALSSPGLDKRRSMALGLEQLPLPRGVAPSGSRPMSNHDPTKNFNAIIGQTESPGTSKRK